MTGEVIKSFLVGLGFGVDDTSLAKFNKAIASATLRVTALYASVKAAGAAIVYTLSKVSEGFEQMGYEYRIIAPAINKTLMLRQELLKAYAAAGIHITKVIQDSVKLNFSLTKTKFAFEALYRSVASRFFGYLTKQSDLLRQKVYANMPKIQNFLEKFVKFIFKALEATTALGLRLWSILTRVYDFFVMLDKATDGWSTRIIAAIAAWKLLNLSFLATPLGMILTGLLAILALFDDFKTWQEGGKSLFDWTPFIPVIEATTQALKSFWAVLNAIADVVGSLIVAFISLFKGDYRGFWDGLADAGNAVLAVFTKLWDTVKNLGSALGTLAGIGGNWLSGLFGNSNVAQNIQSAPGVNPQGPRPVGNNISSAQTNQNVQQQTNINVVGSADAQSIGKSVASEQSKVNFDMVRNMKGATR